MPNAGRAMTRAYVADASVGGKYVLTRKLASGGMGDVWLATNRASGGEVALKILRPAKDERLHARERFRHEAKLGGCLSHRSIVRTYDFLEEPDGTLVLVMELLRGDSLDGYIATRGTLAAPEAIAILVPVLSALQYAHEHGVVHRDVKPSNIFLVVEPDGHVLPKLLDFGIAKTTSGGAKTVSGIVLGTPSYMAPEQVRAESSSDPRSDLFSAGVVLYEMLTGICPFKGESPGAEIAAVLTSEVDPDANIDPRLWIEIQRALKKRPNERFATASEMANALRDAINETESSLAGVLRRSKPPPAPRPLIESEEADEEDEQSQEVAPAAPEVAPRGPASAVTRRPPRRPAWATASVVAALVLVAALGIARLSRSHTPPAPTAASGPTKSASMVETSAPMSGRAPAESEMIELDESEPAAATDEAPQSGSNAARRKPRRQAPRAPARKSIARDPGF